MAVRVDVKVGETVSMRAFNGHMLKYVVTGFYSDGTVKTGSSWNAPHSEKCHCWESEDGDTQLPDW